MNTQLKGKKLQKKVTEILESDNYITEQCNPKLLFIGPGRVRSKKHDFFSAWDVIAICKQSLRLPKWIQVSVWEKASEKKLQVKNFPIGIQFYSEEIWLWYAQGKNGHFRILRRTEGYDWKGECKMPIKKRKEIKTSNI